MSENWKDAPLAVEGETPIESWRQAPRVGSSSLQKAEAFAGSAVGGAAESGLIIPGMYMGAKLGALGGPYAPVTVPLGAAAGGVVGYFAGDELRDLLVSQGLASPRLEKLPEDVRPFAVAGEVVGTGLPIAGAPLGFAAAGARLPASKVGNFLNKIIETAAKHPGTFAAAETSSLFSAGTAGGIAEDYFPGRPGIRMAAEISGGFLNPIRLIMAGFRASTSFWKGVVSSLSREGRITHTAKVLQEMVEEAGEDPVRLAKLLRESNLPNIQMTSAQKSGSPVMILLEQKLAQDNAKFGAEQKKIAEESLSAIKDMIVSLRGAGDPASLKVAGELRTKYFRTLIASRMQSAERAATEAAARMGPQNPTTRSELSRQAQELLEGAIDDVRKAEGSLWDKIPRDIPGRAENIVMRYNQLKGELLPEEKLPALVEGFVERMKEAKDASGLFKIPQASTTGELTRFRSRMLSLAREASAQQKFNDARIYGNLAEAALDDLDAIPSVLPELSEARSFSRELHQVFTQTFAGQSLRETGYGAPRIPPELMLRRALGSGTEVGNLRLQQIEDAVGFLSKKGLEGPEHLDTIIGVQNNLVRLAASDAIDPNTGRASVTRLTTFMKRHQEILSKFPDVKADIETALKSERGLKSLENLVRGQERVLQTQTAFARITQFESPVDAIRNVLRESEKAPVKAMTGLIKLAKRSGDDAVQGLKASVWDDALRRATDDQGGIQFNELQKYLFDPVRPGKPSLVQILENNGVIGADDVKHIKMLLSEGQRIEKAAKGATGLVELSREPGGFLDLVTRIGGAKIGSLMAKFGGPSGGHELIAAGAGSRFLRRIMQRLPRDSERKILIEAMLDPKFAAMLLEKPKTPKEAIKLGVQIHAYLLQAGLTYDEGIPQD